MNLVLTATIKSLSITLCRESRALLQISCFGIPNLAYHHMVELTGDHDLALDIFLGSIR